MALETLQRFPKLDVAPGVVDWVRSSKVYNKTSIARDPRTYKDFPHSTIDQQTGVNQWLEACHVTPISAIEWFWTEGNGFGPRVLNDSMWFYFSQVDGWARVGNEKPFRIGPRSLVLLPRGVEHEIRHNHGQAQLYAVHFQATIYGEINLLDLLGYPYHIVAGKRDRVFEEVSRRMSREYALKAPGWATAISAELMTFLVHVLRTSGDQFRPLAQGCAQSDLPRLLPALVWIHQNLYNPECRVSKMARTINTCEGQFRKLFRRTMGFTPVHFVQRQRMERACHLLNTTHLPITQIAEACGFSDVPFFYRVFRKWMKVPPRKYRLAATSEHRSTPNSEI